MQILINLFKQFSLAMRLSRVGARLSRLEKSRSRVNRDLNARRRQLLSLQDDLTSLASSIQQSLDDAKQVHDEYRSELETARRQIVVMESTERALVEANAALLARWKAQTAIHMRQVGMLEQQENNQ